MDRKAQKKAAIQRRRDGVADFKTTLGSVSFKKVAVVTKAMTFSQLNIFMIPDLNDFVREVVGTSIDVITKHSLPPCIKTDFVVRDWVAIKNHYDILIATDLDTCQECIRTSAGTIVFYVFDLDFIDRLDMMYFDITQCFADKRVKIITRSLEYKQLIETEFQGTSVTVVEDFDLRKLLEGV